MGVYLLSSPLTFLLQWGSEIWRFALFRYCLLSYPSTWLPPKIWFRAPPPLAICLLISCKIQKVSRLGGVLDANWCFCKLLFDLWWGSETPRDLGKGRDISKCFCPETAITHSWLSLRGMCFALTPAAPAPTPIRIYFRCVFCFKLFGIARDSDLGRIFAWKGIVKESWLVTSGRCQYDVTKCFLTHPPSSLLSWVSVEGTLFLIYKKE